MALPPRRVPRCSMPWSRSCASRAQRRLQRASATLARASGVTSAPVVFHSAKRPSGGDADVPRNRELELSHAAVHAAA